MKAKIEKRHLRAKKEVSLIKEKIKQIDKQIQNLNTSAQALVNQMVGKQGAVNELEEILAGLIKVEQEVDPNA